MLELGYAPAASCSAISGPKGDGIVLIICIIYFGRGSKGPLRSNVKSPAGGRCERGLMSRTLKSNKWKHTKNKTLRFSARRRLERKSMRCSRNRSFDFSRDKEGAEGNPLPYYHEVYTFDTLLGTFKRLIAASTSPGLQRLGRLLKLRNKVETPTAL